MKCLPAVLALASIVACGPSTGRRIDESFQSARLAMWRGDLASALDAASRGLTLTESTPESEAAWKLRLLRAEILLTKPDLSQALPILTQAMPEASPFAALRARQKYLVARSQVVQGRLSEALTTLEEAARQAPDDLELRLDAGVLGGQIRMRLGKWDEAESRLNETVAEAVKTGDRYREVLALNNLGMGMLVRNRCDEALQWFERLLSLKDLDQMLVYSVAMNNAGICYARLGRFDRAIAVQQQAVEMHQRQGGATYEAQALGELGTTYLLQDDVERARPYFQQALEIAKEIGNNEDAALWAGNLAAAALVAGQLDEAEQFNEEAKRLNPPNRANRVAWTTLYSGRIAAARGQSDEARGLFEQALASSDGQPRLKWAAHEGLADIANDAGDKASARRHFEAALEAIERTRADLLKTDYKLSFLSELIRFYRNYVDMLVDQGATENALEIADSSRGRVLADGHGIAPPARARASTFTRLAGRSGTVLVSYWLARVHSLVWVVDGRGVKVYRLPPAAEIEKLVAQHVASIQNSMSDPLAARGGAGDQLFQLLVAPVLGSIPPGSSVIIVPDGALHGLNFETLPVDGPRRHYWIEDVEVQVAPALALLTESVSAPPVAPALLVIGNPTSSDSQFPPLRYAAAEMSSIAGHFAQDRTTSFQGDRASPAAYRESGPGRFTLVHFAAHAAANVDSPLDSAVILSGSDLAHKLYARDVATMPLRAELVTVSACRSAGERAYTGEGLIGFAWAFLRAGARRVVAGLWDVDDRSTAELMDSMYARLADGDSPPSALRQAKLALLARGGTTAKPYYWGPFQVFTVTTARRR